eukprot:g3141.t1
MKQTHLKNAPEPEARAALEKLDPEIYPDLARLQSAENSVGLREVHVEEVEAPEADGEGAKTGTGSEDPAPPAPISTNSAGIAESSAQLVGRVFPNSFRHCLSGDDFVAYVVVDSRDREVLEERVKFNNVRVTPILKSWRNFRQEVADIKADTEAYAYSAENWYYKQLQLRVFVLLG